MFKRNKKLLAYLAILALSLTLLFVNQTFLHPFKMCLVDITSLPTRIILFPFQEIKKIIFYHSTFTKYEKLKKEMEDLRGQTRQHEELARENQRLKSLLELKGKSKYPMVAANVIGRDPSNWHAIIFIDRGQKEGIRQGMPVVTAASVIGKIVEVGNKTSKVMLISDPAFSVAALLERSREEGLVTGTLAGVCRMRYLSLQADIRVGDKVITSKLSSSFPEGLLIGEVAEIKANTGSPTIECLVLPAASPSQIEEVLIIRK